MREVNLCDSTRAEWSGKIMACELSFLNFATYYMLQLVFIFKVSGLFFLENKNWMSKTKNALQVNLLYFVGIVMTLQLVSLDWSTRSCSAI